MSAAPRLKEAQENIKKITADKRVETKKINANSLVRCSLQSAGRGGTSFCVNTSATDIHNGYSSHLSNRKRDCARSRPLLEERGESDLRTNQNAGSPGIANTTTVPENPRYQMKKALPAPSLLRSPHA